MTPLAWIAVCALSAAETWAVLPLEQTNVHPGHVDATRVVLKTHIEALGQRAFVVNPSEGEDARAAAAQQGATRLVEGSLVRLGSKVKVSLRVSALDGTPVSHGSMDAMSPEDLDTVLMRLARYFVHGEPLESARIAEVVEEEQSAYGRKQANNYFGVSVIGMPVASAEGAAFLAGAGIYWLYDARSFFAEIELSLAGADNDGARFALSVAGLYPFTDSDVTPVLGGGLGWTALGNGAGDKNGLQVFADAGVIIGRTNTVHFRVDAKPFVATFRLQGELVYGAALQVGVGF